VWGIDITLTITLRIKWIKHNGQMFSKAWKRKYVLFPEPEDMGQSSSLALPGD
jgi:hypothetical protein